jgi:hypothetical protein
MRAWIYERGRWVEARYPFREEFDDLGRELERLGFERHETLSFGSRHGSSLSVRVYEAQDIATLDAVEGPVDVEFLVSVSTATRRYPVFVVDLPSLVQLMSELHPMLASEREKADFRDR